MRKIIIGLSIALFINVANAQDQVQREAGSTEPKQTPEYYANMRTKAYDDALELTKEQSAKMTEIFTAGENGVVDLRAACREAQRNLEAAMRDFEDKAESLLSKEQQAKLLSLRKNKEFNGDVPSCAVRVHSSGIDATSKDSGKAGPPKPIVAKEVVPEITAPE